MNSNSVICKKYKALKIKKKNNKCLCLWKKHAQIKFWWLNLSLIYYLENSTLIIDKISWQNDRIFNKLKVHWKQCALKSNFFCPIGLPHTDILLLKYIVIFSVPTMYCD